ncbi:MAG TPA: hemerythrin domain-containing protein [Chitinophagaceae bacterium]|nr:hemerythrin domain-containing protein [Chitinophagaceae bacterium]
MKHFIYILLLVLFISRCQPKEEKSFIQFPGMPEVPLSIKKDHEYLLDQIHKITLFQDSAGNVAIKLNELMQHHFKEEEEFVLPPLGLLTSLASGKMPEQSSRVIQLTDKISSQLTHLNAEHQFIRAYMDELKKADPIGSHPEILVLEKELHQHANLEEEVLFPAAILIGEYLKLKVTIKP